MKINQNDREKAETEKQQFGFNGSAFKNCNYSEPHLDSAALHFDVAARHMKFQKKPLIHASMIRNFFLPFHMALNSYILSCALIVRNTFGFRSLGILGCEGENNHGCDKRHHVVNVLGQSQMGEDGGVRNVCQGTEYRKE